MRRRHLEFLAAGLALGTAVGCGSQGTTPTPAAPTSTVVTAPRAITVTGNASLVAPTQTTQLTANATLSTGSTQNVTSQATWESTNAIVVTVASSGLATARGFGSAEIRATYQGVIGTLALSVAPPLNGTLLKYDVAADVPVADLSSIKTGISEVQSFLNAQLGGDIPVNQQVSITVKVVATGLGNPDPGGAGACCTGLDSNGAARPFFDVKNVDWHLVEGSYPWPLSADHEKTAAHEYTHGWAWSLGGLPRNSRPLSGWLTEGLAEYIAYSTMVSVGKMPQSSVDSFMLSSAIYTGEANRCLDVLDGIGLWAGHIGYVALRKLLPNSPNGILSLRIVNADIGAGRSLDQAFQDAFGVSRQDFYNSFPAYVASLGGPGSCS